MQAIQRDVVLRAGRRWSALASNVPLPEQNLLGLAAGLLMQRVLPWRLSGGMYRKAPGIAAMAAGSILIGWSWAAARRTLLAQPEVLVTAGPYALCRNPMYVGWSLLHLGIGLVRDDAWTIAALPFSAAAVHRQVLREESELGERFGSGFRHYADSVPRYLPAGSGGTWRPNRTTAWRLPTAVLTGEP